MIDEFVDSRRARWERLEFLLVQVRKNNRSLPAADLEDLGRLYRQATSDLAIARRDFPRDRVTRYLDQLVGRAHPAVYQAEAGDWAGVVRFFAQTYPRAFREAAPYTIAAFLMFAVPFIAAVVATRIDPLAGHVILPPGPVVDQIDRGESWLDVDAPLRSMMASFIMTHNIQVAFLAFGGGVLCGLGAAFVLAYNGLFMGALVGLATTHGLGGALASFVVAHGEIELTVIFVAGGAGLRLGHALLAPGLVTRGTALADAASRAIQLLFGCIPLLMIAGSLEGFVSPSELAPAAKAVIGATATTALYAYLLLGGRSKG